MRFDDTNPAKEDAHFEEVILADLKLLQVTPDRFTHTSDYFDLMLQLCDKMINDGHAYVDDTDAETMKAEREERKESKNRNNAVDKNISMWKQMKSGTEFGQKCAVRAKIDMNSNNGCMRDPTIYRCKPEPHVRTGTKYKVYPTYDFACPIVDSVEGVTHALRTTEYHDRDDQFFWFIEKLGLRKLHIYEYSRLNMNNTVLSKRKLTWFVEQGLVDGWDDPRFPTVRGIMRRGMTVEGLKEFIIAQGSSRSVVNMEWDKIWSFNKKVIDATAPRYTALEKDRLLPVNVTNAIEQENIVQKHPKDPSIGTKTVWVGPKVLIEAVDADLLKEGENATFINWGNLLIKKIHKDGGKVVSVDAETNLDNTDYKKTLKVTWLVDSDKAPFTPTVCVSFDHLINKGVLGKDEDFKTFIGHETRFETAMLGDDELKLLKKGDIIQFQRKGFFKVDQAYIEPNMSSCKSSPVVLFAIPDGHSKDTNAAATSKPPSMSAKELTQSAKGKKAEKSPQEETKPVVPAAGPSTEISDIHSQITEKGNVIRQLKADKADKNVVMSEVAILKELKTNFKTVTGVEWTPNIDMGQFSSTAVSGTTESAPLQPSNDALAIHQKIIDQGNVVRNLKTQKADKAAVTAAVNDLLSLKKDFKDATSIDWAPNIDTNQFCRSSATQNISPVITAPVSTSAVKSTSTAPADVSAISIHGKIVEQGNTVRNLKSSKASKNDITGAVNVLLALKKEFKECANIDWTPNIDMSQFEKASLPASARVNDSIKDSSAPNESLATHQNIVEQGNTKQTRLGLEVSKRENLSEWYSQVITKSEMIEYYNVSGCYILRPWSYSIWQRIQNFIDPEIKMLGVENSYFPIFVSRDALEKEKTHIADFSPEVAWVTRSGSSELAEPIAIRPTSETVMYPAFAKWIQSHRDLPLRLNQWNNVVRWEFKQPTPFLRTREFLWQEGHTAFATQAEATQEVYQILDIYARVYEELLAIPVVKGKKTDKEKFAGGDFTTTVEAFISANGRGIQGATSHHLGQNFSKMFDIVYDDPVTQEKQYVYQNSWGLTTRTIGVMVMVHGDDKGLVLPPRVASRQAVVMPVGITAKLSDEDKKSLYNACDQLAAELTAGDVRTTTDYRDNVTPAWKFNHWELKGVPLRLEVGPREVASGKVFVVRRDTGEKQAMDRSTVVAGVTSLLETIQASMLENARKDLNAHKKLVASWPQFCQTLDEGNIVLAPFCGDETCEDTIKKESARDRDADSTAPSMGAKSLCIPFHQPQPMPAGTLCIHPSCRQPGKYYCLFGRSY